MTEYPIQPDGSPVRFFGRTLFDPQWQAMFLNWTAAGFELAFESCCVEMETLAFADEYPGEKENLPWVSVFLDDALEPSQTFRLEVGAGRVRLFESNAPQAHTLRVVKRSENSKGRFGLKAIWAQGELMAAPKREPKLRLEFVGDSITCGFGNEMAADEPVFDVAKENAFAAYPAVAAKLLNADYQCVCISGIPLCWASDADYRLHPPQNPGFTPPMRAMVEHYAFADRNHQEAMGMSEGFTPWDFERFKPDAVVINLGTNDAFRLSVSGCTPQEEAHFTQCYRAFLHQVRRLNGKEPVLACTLGSMDYYLFDAVEKAVAAYQRETGDTKVFCMKFAPIDQWGEGFGGLAHPNVKTHSRMGRELAQALSPWLGKEG